MLLGIVQWEVPRVVLTSERVRSDLYVVICFGCTSTFVVLIRLSLHGVTRVNFEDEISLRWVDCRDPKFHVIC